MSLPVQHIGSKRKPFVGEIGRGEVVIHAQDMECVVSERGIELHPNLNLLIHCGSLWSRFAAIVLILVGAFLAIWLHRPGSEGLSLLFFVGWSLTVFTVIAWIDWRAIKRSRSEVIPSAAVERVDAGPSGFGKGGTFTIHFRRDGQLVEREFSMSATNVSYKDFELAWRVFWAHGWTATKCPKCEYQLLKGQRRCPECGNEPRS